MLWVSLLSIALAVVISYEIESSRVRSADERGAALEARIDALEETARGMARASVKTDDTIIKLIDAFKLAEEKFKAERTAGFWCAIDAPTPGFITFGLCKRTEAACERWRATGVKLKLSDCIKQEHASCAVSSDIGGANSREDCFPNGDLCRAFTVEMGEKSKRLFLECETK